MAKKPPILTILDKVSASMYTPNRDERKLKASFWASIEQEGHLGEETVSLARAMQVTGDTRLEKWWTKEGFSEWFTNKHEIDQRMEYLIHKGLDAMEALMESDDPKALSSQVNAFKALMEYRGKVQKTKAPARFLDSMLDTMSEEDADRMISGLAKKHLGDGSDS